MRLFIAALLLCLLPLTAQAKPSPYRSVNTFAGDRWQMAQGADAQDVTRAMRCPPPHCSRRPVKTKWKKRHRRKPAHFYHSIATHVPPARKSLLGGLAREIGAAFGTPRRFVRGRLICAVNVNAALAERGIKGTHSALARSFLHWGRPSGPVPGAVAVFSRRGGGHVNIVHHVRPNGMVIYLNPSASRQRWVIGPYRKRPISYRVAA